MNVRLGAKTKEFNTKLSQASYKITQLGKRISKLGSTITRSFSLPFAAAGAASVKMSLDFQKSMTKIQTLVGKTSSEIESMKSDILEMSGDVAKSPVELANGLYFLESAGLRGANAMETLEQVAKGSATGLGDMEALSVVAAAAQNAYGKEVITASEALDKFGVMVRMGMFDAKELSDVLGRQLGLASNLGISFDEVGALISTYTQTTGDATAATNGLSAIMMTFAKLESEPTEKQAEALAKIGMSADQVKQMLGEQGLMATLQHLQTQFGNNDVAMASFFSRSQGLKAALGVLGSQTEAYTANLDAMEESTNFVNDAFATTAETDAFKMEQALNKLKVAAVQFGDTLLPVVNKITEKIVALTDWWTGLDKTTQENIATIGTWVAVFGPVLMIMGKLIVSFGSAIKLYKNWRVATMAATGAQSLLNAVLIANPIGLIITAIGALVAAIIVFSKSNSKIAKQVRNVFKFLANGIIDSINFIIKGINSMSKYFGYTIEPIKKFKYESEDALDDVGDSVEDTTDKIEELSNTASNIKPTKVKITGSIETESERDDRERKEQRALENIRKLKQQFNVLNTDDKHKSELIALNNQEQNALLEVENTKHATEEKENIQKLFAQKRKQLLAKQAEENKKQLEAELTSWEEMFEKIEQGFNNISNVISQLYNSWGKLSDAQLQKEQTIMENKQARENEDYENWYNRELLKIEQTVLNEEAKQQAIEELDEVAATKKSELEAKQDEETKKFQKKAAKRDKSMKLMSAIMGTAQAVVTALGSTVPPLNFVLAGIVGGMGAAQIATIASTPIPALAEGGIAFGPTIAQVGEYKGARANPEVIAPLNKLQGMLGTNQNQKIEIFGRLDGNDIWLSNNLTNTNRLRYT